MEEIAQEVAALEPKDAPTSAPSHGLSPFLRWPAAGAITGMLAALVDTFDTAVSGFEGSLGFYLWYALTSLGTLLALIGAALGAWVLGARRLGGLLPARWGPAGQVVFLALPCAAFVAWVPTSWIVEHGKQLSASEKTLARAVYPAAFVGSVLLAWLVLRVARSYRDAEPRLPALHLSWLGVSGAVAVASYLADRWVLVGLYEDFHYGLSAAFLASLAVFWVLGVKTVLVRRPGLGSSAFGFERARYAGTGLALTCGLLVAVERLSPDVFGPGRSPLFPKLLRTVRARTDFDRDGLSHLFGGSDCAPFDARIRPGKFDMPGNQKDEDCTGSDAAWPAPAPPGKYAVPLRKDYNVLLVTVDALRADHLGAYGYTRHPTTPNLDRLARRSIRFAEAFTPAPKTHRAMPALATGLYPSNMPRDYGAKLSTIARKRGHVPLTTEAPLLSEVLQESGYRTVAFHAVHLRHIGLDRGFDEYTRTREATKGGMDAMSAHARAAGAAPPFFLWLHYFSPHWPYEKREGFDFGDDDVARYDSDIAFDDREIGILLDRLDDLGLRERTIVVLTADHGEEFREHGGTKHGFRLYRELTHVPLLLFVPGVAPAVVTTPVELVDIFPTVCELLELQAGCPGHDGQSLLAAAAGKRDPARGAYSELHTRDDVPAMNAVFTGRWHMIYDYELDRAELYDMTRDRAEQHNVAGAHPELVRRFRDQLAMRPIERQARVIGDYLRNEDAEELVAALPLLRHERLLALALDKLTPVVKASHVPELKKLRGRPGLPRGLRDRIDGLSERAKKRAKR